MLKSQMFLFTDLADLTPQPSEPDTTTADIGPMTKSMRLKTGFPFILTVLFCSALKNYLIFNVKLSNILTNLFLLMSNIFANSVNFTN